MENFLDVKTLFVVFALIQFLLAIILIVLSHLWNGKFGTGLWVYGTVLLLISFILLVLRHKIPIELSLVVGNGILLLGMAFIYISACRFTEAPPHIKTAIAIFLLSWGPFVFFYQHPLFYFAKVPVISIGLASYSLLIAFVFLKKKQKRTYATNIISVFFFLHALINICRGSWYYFSSGQDLSLLSSESLSLAFYIWVLIFLSGSSIAYIVMVVERIYETLLVKKNKAQSLQERAEKAMQEQRNFYGLMSHEFRTSINKIDVARENLAYELNTETSLEEIRSIDEANKQLKYLLDTLLGDRFFEIYEDSDFYKRSSLAKILREVSEEWNVAYVDFTGRALYISNDPWLTKLIFNILLDNAVKYSRVSENVVIRLYHRTTRYLIVEVVDDGAGVPVEDREKIFSKYYRGVNSKGINGSGLGLYLVKSVLDLQKATIENLRVDGLNVFRVCFSNIVDEK